MKKFRIKYSINELIICKAYNLLDHVATIVGWEVYVDGNEMKMCDSV